MYRCERIEARGSRDLDIYYEGKKAGVISRLKNREILTLDYESNYIYMSYYFTVYEVIQKQGPFLDQYKDKLNTFLWLFIKKADLDWLCYPYEANYTQAALC